MSLSPQLVERIRATHRFTEAELKIIGERWDDFSQDLRFNSCTNAEMIKEARAVLECAKLYPAT